MVLGHFLLSLFWKKLSPTCITPGMLTRWGLADAFRRFGSALRSFRNVIPQGAASQSLRRASLLHRTTTRKKPRLFAFKVVNGSCNLGGFIGDKAKQREWVKKKAQFGLMACSNCPRQQGDTRKPLMPDCKNLSNKNGDSCNE
jgi:hypothetical protein